MVAPLTEEQRAAVVEAAGRPGATRNGVARETGVSEGSVTNICTEAGITFDRSQTEAAVKARVVDLRAGRVSLAGDLLDDVTAARARMLATDDARGFSDMAKAVHYLTGSHTRLAAFDKDDSPGLDAAKSMLGRLGVALGVAMAGGPDDEPAGEGDDGAV